MKKLTYTHPDHFNGYKNEGEGINGQRHLILEKKLDELNHQLKQSHEELKTALGQLRTTQQQLVQQEQLASLGQLTAGIAHEVKNPLNFIHNFSEVSRELLAELNETSTDEARKEILKNVAGNLEKISKHSLRADAILRRMLEHSHQSATEKTPTDINQVCEEYLILSYQSMRAKNSSFNCSVEKHLDPALPKVNVVAQEICQVIVNLIKNALEAVNEKMQRDPDYRGMFSLTTEQHDHTIFIRIRDNGPGIPQKIQQKIFEPFFTTKPPGEGTGLGLSLCKDFIKANGGELTVASKENEFTEFTVSLPVN